MLKITPFGLYQVAGESMLPTYQPGTRLLGLRWFRRHTLQPGAIIVARQNHRLVIKRLASFTSQGAMLLGDNPSASTDSRSLGVVPLSAIEAVIISKVVQ